MSEHEPYMRRAIELARKVPELPFGSVIVRDHEVIAEGWNRSVENPIWHGEIDAINQCAHTHRGIDWAELTLYTTAEPCPMCQAAILWAGIPRVVFGTSVRYLQSRGWWQIDILAEEIIRRTPFRTCNLIGGILEAECNALVEKPPKGYSTESS
jgi:tRNA(Arg) A34 adenosine deaminase TadA